MGDEDNKVKRSGPRHPVDWRVRLRCPDWKAVHRVAAANVSRGGFFITTSTPPLPGSRVELTVELPDGMQLRVLGTCIHTRSPQQALELGKPPGFGLKVDEAFHSDLLLLEQMAQAAVAPPPLESLEASAGESFDEAKTPAWRKPEAPENPEAGIVTTREKPAPVARVPTAPGVGERISPGVRSPDEVEERGPSPWPEPHRPAHEGPQAPVAAPRPAGPTLQPQQQGTAAPRPTHPGWVSAAAPPQASPSPPASGLGAALGQPDGRPAVPVLKRPSVPAKQEPLAVGIDFGTTYTRVAVYTPDGVFLVADDAGRTLMPSVVSYPDEGGCVVGWPARELLAHQPQRTVASSKRLLGRSADDMEIQGLLASSAFRTERGPQGQLLLQMGQEILAVPQVCAAIIREAVLLAEKRLGVHVQKAVFTIPVTFGEPQKAALRRAAMLAGVEVLGLIEEPVAGALAYGYGKANDVVAVYDFGGGTFDFTLLDISQKSFRVLVTRGDAWLGGDDLDLALAQWAADQFWRQTRVELRQRVVEWQRLLLACEAAKVRLSSEEATTIEVPDIVRRMDLRIPVDRARARELWREFVDRSLEVCREALDEAQMEPSLVSAVILTGGTTHIPLVREAVEQLFDRPLEPAVSPDIAVVQGGAIQAARLLGVTG